MCVRNINGLERAFPTHLYACMGKLQLFCRCAPIPAECTLAWLQGVALCSPLALYSALPSKQKHASLHIWSAAKRQLIYWACLPVAGPQERNLVPAVLGAASSSQPGPVRMTASGLAIPHPEKVSDESFYLYLSWLHVPHASCVSQTSAWLQVPPPVLLLCLLQIDRSS